MARPKKCRRICSEPSYECFSPDGTPSGEPICLTLDEYEVIRLMDCEGLTQEQSALQMEVARTTVTDIYDAARKKIADAIVNGRVLYISGGSYKYCDGSNAPYCRKKCTKDTLCQVKISEKGENIMRVAVTYEDGQIFQHFGHTEAFEIFDIEDGKIVSEQVVDTNGQGHGALAGFLTSSNVDVLICGGIGGGAQNALAEAGIKLYGGVSGSTDAAVKALIEGSLSFDPNVHCDHHDHEGSGQSCGEHGCGSHGCH